MRRWVIWGALLAIGADTPATAGIVFRQMQRTESSDAGMNNHQISQVLVEGAMSKILVEESSNPMIPKGAYFLSTGGDITYLVNPAAKTIARIDRAEMQAMTAKAGEMAEQQERMGMKREVRDVKLEQKLDENGPAMLGLPTRHYRYIVSYTEKLQAPGMGSGMSTKVEEQHEFWATTALDDDAAVSAWRKDQLAEYAGEYDSAVQQAVTRMYAHGFFLKHISVVKSTMSMPGMIGMMPGMGGGTDTDRTTREILELRRETVPASVFEVPKGYAETDFFSPGATGMPDLNTLPGLGGGKEDTMPDLDGLPR